MRWCYKTVHFDLKKEGFLGNTFLDEAEVEQSLNEYGQSGWELVSIVETQDGVIAFFKQPLEPVTKHKVQPHPVEEYEVLEEDITSQSHKDQELWSKTESVEEQNPENDNNDPYSIRIE
jgi:hypothetical protein